MSQPITWRGRVAFLAGAILVSVGLLAGGEAFLRSFPPPDFRPYLGADSGLKGPFRSDARFGVQYASREAFAAEYPAATERYRSALTGSEPTCWAMFGNSFVHMEGMLADTTRARFPARPVFNLGRNEPPFVRAAQVDFLLRHGLRAERIFFVLLPHDVIGFAQHSLAQTHASPEGGLVHEPRLTGGPLDLVLSRSRLALLAWVRSGQHQVIPNFHRSGVNRELPAVMVDDLRHLLNTLGETSREHAVPITLVLIPNHEQITRGARCGVQDHLAPISQTAGLDLCDVRAAFQTADDRAALFLPDKHFSERGNRILLDAILSHLSQRPAGDRVTLGGPRP